MELPLYSNAKATAKMKCEKMTLHFQFQIKITNGHFMRSFMHLACIVMHTHTQQMGTLFAQLIGKLYLFIR